MGVALRRMFDAVKLLEHIAQRVHVTEAGCWEWQGRYGDNGYPRIDKRVDGSTKHFQVHRLVVAVLLGFNLRRNLNVLHSCDNNRCVCPDHLSRGSQKRNVRECVERGRHRTPFRKAA